MANSSIKIPFYVSLEGAPLTGASAEMEFHSLMLTDGTDKSGSSPVISEIGSGWYGFEIAWGTSPFDAGDLVGVIDADANGANELDDVERFIPVEVRLDYYGLMRLVNNMSQDKITGDMCIKNNLGDTILKLGITDNEATLDRIPEC